MKKIWYGFMLVALIVVVGYGILLGIQNDPSNIDPTIGEPSFKAMSPEPMLSLEVMPVEEKVGQMFVGGYHKANLIEEQMALVEEYDLSGVILMGPNVSDPLTLQETLQLVQETQGQTSLPLIVSIDEEGGVITRLKDQLTEQTPQSTILTPDQAYEVARDRGRELALLDINVVYSPVLDQALEESFLYERTFHVPANDYAELGASMLEGFHHAGIMGVPKHFPGHPLASLDSHTGLPISPLSRSELDEHMLPFVELVNTYPPRMMMTGHILFPQIDEEYPATLSPTFIQDVLRDELGYEGVVVTDDLNMDAISENYSPAEAAILAVEAGNDIVLYVSEIENQRVAIEGILAAVESGRISEERINESVERILDLKEGL